MMERFLPLFVLGSALCAYWSIDVGIVGGDAVAAKNATETTGTTDHRGGHGTKARAKTHKQPRPQYVFHIYYHKTGWDVTHQYLDAVNVIVGETTRDLEERTARAKEGGHPLLGITHEVIDTMDLLRGPRRKSRRERRRWADAPTYEKRTHDNTTGVPCFSIFRPTNATNKTRTRTQRLIRTRRQQRQQ